MKETTSNEIMLAWGFRGLFFNVLHRHHRTLRLAITKYLGSVGTYYRYHNGEYLLTPRQQQAILDICRSFGYTDGLFFDHYKSWNERSSSTGERDTRWNEHSSATSLDQLQYDEYELPIKNNF